MERNLQRTEIAHGVSSIGSVRGPPAIIIIRLYASADPNTADEEKGSCYGFLFSFTAVSS